MKFSLEWKQTATDELADIWLRADSRTRRKITAATVKVDDLLKRDPYGESESREGDRRIMFVAPLAITFRVDPEVDNVEVLRVRRFRDKSSPPGPLFLSVPIRVISG
ncbi:MAG: hypothetical protein ACREHD_14280 [Pirellulales bacterium]